MYKIVFKLLFTFLASYLFISDISAVNKIFTKNNNNNNNGYL